MRTGAAGTLCYVDVARRKELVNWPNKAKQTPLHYSAKGEGRAERDAIGRVQIAAWLVREMCSYRHRYVGFSLSGLISARKNTILLSFSYIFLDRCCAAK